MSDLGLGQEWSMIISIERHWGKSYNENARKIRNKKALKLCNVDYKAFLVVYEGRWKNCKKVRESYSLY